MTERLSSSRRILNLLFINNINKIYLVQLANTQKNTILFKKINPPVMQETQETWVLSLSWEDPLETSDPVLVAQLCPTLL